MNVVWGWFNLALGYLLILQVGEFDLRSFGRLEPGAWKNIGVAVLAPLMSQLDSAIVNVSLASIRDDLHSSISAAQ